jgi:hypothetical protein
MVHPFYVNRLRPTIGSRSHAAKPIYLNRIFFNIAEGKRLFAYKEKRFCLAAFETVIQELLTRNYSAGI